MGPKSGPRRPPASPGGPDRDGPEPTTPTRDDSRRVLVVRFLPPDQRRQEGHKKTGTAGDYAGGVINPAVP